MSTKPVNAKDLNTSIATQPIIDFTPINHFTAIESKQDTNQATRSLSDFTPTLIDSPSEDAIHIDSDSITGSVDHTLLFKGSPHLQRNGLNITAQEMSYCPNTDEVSANGKVHAIQDRNILNADTFTINTQTQVANAQSVNYFFNQPPARGYADRLISTLNKQRILNDASYTSCPIGNNDWLLKAKTLVLDEINQIGIAKNMHLQFMDIPIFATPYFEFPLGKERRSGFLLPSATYSSQSGLDLSVPYYFNLANHYDATLTTRLMTRRGIQLNANARYLTPYLQGNLNIDALPYDHLQKKSRWGLFSNHTYQLNQDILKDNEPAYTETNEKTNEEVIDKHKDEQNTAKKPVHSNQLTAGINIERVSDSSFFADLSRSNDWASKTILPNELWIQHQSNWGNLRLRASTYQILQDNTNQTITPYTRLPVIDWQLHPIYLPKLGGVTLDFTAQLARFTHKTEPQGIRSYFIPEITKHWLNNWGFFKAKAKLNMAHYSQIKGDTYQGNSQFTRAIPILSLDTGLIFERTMPWFNTHYGKKMVQHTLEPRLYFVYAPFKDQSNVPIFDSALTTFGLEQIFSDNTFIGQDRIANAKHLTPAFSTQWIDPDTGLSVLKATLGRRYYFSPQRVNLYDTTLFNESFHGTITNNNNPHTLPSSSDWLFAATGQLSNKFYIDTALQYDQNQHEVVNSNYTFRYTPAAHHVLSISKRFTKHTKHAIDISTQWRFKTNHAILGKIGYSLGIPNENLERKMTESLLGYEYDAGCWLFRIAAKRYINTANETATSLAFQLELSGLTQSKSNTIHMLSNDIPGYVPFKANPKWKEDNLGTFE